MPPQRRIASHKSPYQPGPVGDATFSIAAESANARVVTVTLKDYNGKGVSGMKAGRWYLASDAAGTTVAATAPSAGVVSGAAGKVHADVAGKSGSFTTNSAGVCNFVVGDAGAYTGYLCVVLPDGSVKVSGAITLAA